MCNQYIYFKTIIYGSLQFKGHQWHLHFFVFKMPNIEDSFKELLAEFPSLGTALKNTQRARTGSAPSQTVQNGDISALTLFELILELIDIGTADPVLVVTFLRHLGKELALMPTHDVICVIDLMHADPRTAHFVPTFAISAALFCDTCFFKIVDPRLVNAWLDLSMHHDLSRIWLRKLVDAFGPDETARIVVNYVKPRLVQQESPRPPFTLRWLMPLTMLRTLEDALATLPIIVNYIDLPCVCDGYAPTYTHYARIKRRWGAQLEYMKKLEAVRLLRAAWKMFRGKPPRAEEDAKSLVRALCLRRFCRVRGEDPLDMESEVVEPFARDIVRFL